MSIKVGLNCLLESHYRLDAMRRILNPLSFPRPEEFREALYTLAPSLETGRVLDLASPKLPILILPRSKPNLEFYSTDILEDFIPPTLRYLKGARLGDAIGRTIYLKTEDARRLSFPDQYFDWVYSISVLEHVADEPGGECGDTMAIREVARVLRPGGTITLTVPFDAGCFWEEFLEGPVYERSEHPGEKTFYQRHYDESALRRRIIEPSGLACEALVFFGEAARIQIEPWWNRIPMKLKVPVLPFQGVLGNILFKELPPSKKNKARGVAIKLVKQPA